MIKIAVKGDKGYLRVLEKAGFQYCELFIKRDDILNELPKTRMKIISIHLPNLIKVENKFMMLNLADNSVIGEKSEKKLEQVIDYAKKVGCKKVVIHIGSSKNQNAYETVAKRLERVNDPKVLICIENVTPWYTIPSSLAYNADTLLKLKNQTKIPLGIVLDIEHLYLTAYYKKINPETLVKDFFKKIQPDIIHVCGSNYYNYVPYVKPVGEHIPIRFEGKLKNKNVKDKINHELWLSELNNKDIPIVLEIDTRAEYDHIKELLKSKYFLEERLIS